MNLVNLDEETRKYMLEEISSDVKGNKLYISKRLTDTGRKDYEQLLHEAVENYDADWLASKLGESGRMATVEQSHSKTGRSIVKHTPSTDHVTLAYGEFNYYYIRALCVRAIQEKIDHLVVYRARDVAEQRVHSASMIGNEINPSDLLNDLRTDIAQRGKKFGIPGGPNSGISVRLP